MIEKGEKMSEKTRKSDQDEKNNEEAINNPTLPSQSPHEMRHTARQARHEQRRKWREENREFFSRGSNETGWIAGVLLIAIGVMFLFRTTLGIYLENWWALFILIPAWGAFAKAWDFYRKDGRLGWFARRSLFAGVLLTFIAVAFLFNIDWVLAFPALLILVGVGILVNSLLPKA